MTVSIDVHPAHHDSKLVVSARTFFTVGTPVMIEVRDSRGERITEVSLFTRDPELSDRICKAINDAQNPPKDPLDELAQLVDSGEPKAAAQAVDAVRDDLAELLDEPRDFVGDVRGEPMEGKS